MITKEDIITINLGPNEVRYCNRLASQRFAGQKIPGEQVDPILAQEFCCYALCKHLFGMVSSQATWLMRRLAKPKLSLPPSNITVHGRKLGPGQKLSEHTTESSGTGYVDILAWATFSFDKPTADVYLLGWARGVAENGVVTRADLHPIPPVVWDWWLQDTCWEFNQSTEVQGDGQGKP